MASVQRGCIVMQASTLAELLLRMHILTIPAESSLQVPADPSQSPAMSWPMPFWGHRLVLCGQQLYGLACTCSVARHVTEEYLTRRSRF
jgi:hypothetical protein